MSDYSFHTLAPNEFEELIKDLLERHLGMPLQAFTTGRDGGIDLRHAPASDNTLVIQCKHYAGSRFADLKRSVSKEVEKLHRIQPQRYVVATSCGLTPDNVNELFELLSPYCISKHDIVGKSDLNALLRANGDIERRHPKLWITSESVLNRVLQNDVFVQSDMTRESILRRLSLYVYTPRFEDAQSKLNTDRVCIISGVPGVGKTTLAEMLLVEHLMDGWELVTIHQNVSEGLRALQANPDSKQIFYYDDFLGQVSSGEKLAKNEDGALIQLLRAIQHSASKRFILTTREYILAQAKREHEKLARSNLDIYSFVVECTDYDEEAKARILANHLYFNEVPQEYIASIVREGGYREVIDHDNYNPRLIESMTSRMELASVGPDDYLEAFIARLDDPSQLWEHIYGEQLSEASRHVLLAVVATGTPAPLSQVERDFRTLYNMRSREFGWTQHPNDFERSLNELEGNFLRIQTRGGQRVIEWHNPSVLDFLGSWLRRHRTDTEALLASSDRFEQIATLTDTVPVLTPTDSQASGARPDEKMLADAISRNSAAIGWVQLQTAIRLADHFAEGQVREQILTTARRLFDAKNLSTIEIPAAISVIEDLELRSWIDPSLLEDWRKQIKRLFLNFNEDSFDELDQFMPISEWVSSNMSDLTADELKFFQQSARQVVHQEADASFSPNMESIWSEMKDRVEELQDNLEMDFTNEIRDIERKMQDADRPDETTESVGRKVENTSVSTIDAIFAALIQS